MPPKRTILWLGRGKAAHNAFHVPGLSVQSRQYYTVRLGSLQFWPTAQSANHLQSGQYWARGRNGRVQPLPQTMRFKAVRTQVSKADNITQWGPGRYSFGSRHSRQMFAKPQVQLSGPRQTVFFFSSARRARPAQTPSVF